MKLATLQGQATQRTHQWELTEGVLWPAGVECTLNNQHSAKLE
jgi:hypothetical protein